MPGASLLLATANPGKAVEVRSLLPGVQVQTLADHPELEMPPESADTFVGNAQIKAVFAAKALGRPALADDSGLVVDALDGAPGVYSARYGPGSDEDRYRKLLSALESVPDEARTARFVCSMVFALPDGTVFSADGTVEGKISRAPVGEGGFGYDPVFWLPAQSASMAQLSKADKNAISHRGRALRAILPKIQAHFQAGS